jgi:hypothetical protein
MRMPVRLWFPLLALMASLPCVAKSGAVIPRDTRVAILPVVNAAGTKSVEDRDKQTKAAMDALTEDFSLRGFTLIDRAAVDKAVAGLKVDLADEEQQKRSTLFSIGETIHADLVVFAVITDLDSRDTVTIWSGRKVGKAKVKLWLLDVPHHGAIVSGVVTEAKSERPNWFNAQKGADRKLAAIARSVDRGLDGFLNDYPLIKSDRQK